jgi:hypothetical protein
MLRSKPALTGILVLLAVAVAVVTAVGILTLPTVGSIRYSSADSRSALAQLRSSLQAVGITQPTGTIQNLVRRDTHPLAFRAPTYWSNSDIAGRRANYLSAGGVLVLTLLLSAVLLARWATRERVAQT